LRINISPSKFVCFLTPRHDEEETPGAFTRATHASGSLPSSPTQKKISQCFSREFYARDLTPQTRFSLFGALFVFNRTGRGVADPRAAGRRRRQHAQIPS
jgi:hypothetical protein